jgi:hypothetical protein
MTANIAPLSMALAVGAPCCGGSHSAACWIAIRWGFSQPRIREQVLPEAWVDESPDVSSVIGRRPFAGAKDGSRNVRDRATSQVARTLPAIPVISVGDWIRTTHVEANTRSFEWALLSRALLALVIFAPMMYFDADPSPVQAIFVCALLNDPARFRHALLYPISRRARASVTYRFAAAITLVVTTATLVAAALASVALRLWAQDGRQVALLPFLCALIWMPVLPWPRLHARHPARSDLEDFGIRFGTVFLGAFPVFVTVLAAQDLRERSGNATMVANLIALAVVVQIASYWMLRWRYSRENLV